MARGRHGLQAVGDRGFSAAGKALRCPICGDASFEKRHGVLDTRGASFFGWTWANRGSTELICDGCHYVMTFADEA